MRLAEGKAKKYLEGANFTFITGAVEQKQRMRVGNAADAPDFSDSETDPSSQ